MVRGKDACWEHCVLVDASRQKVRCNYCQREFSGGVYRMKFHLAQIKNKDIVPCIKVPDDVRDSIRIILTSPKKQKPSKKQTLDNIETPNCQQNSSSASGSAHPNNNNNHESNGHYNPVMSPHPSLSSLPVLESQKQDNADKKVALFFLHNAIPFNAAKSVYYQEMVDAIAECGVGYKGPTYEHMKSSLLERVKDDFREEYTRLKDEWKETGCTILCDCLYNPNTKIKSIMVFSVTSPKGTLFLKSADVSAHIDDAQFLYELIESIVLEVGIEDVIQVITDSTPSFVYAGRLLMAKHPSLFWSPCASHCINQILEDFRKQEWVNKVLEEGHIITTYIHSYPWSLNLIRKYTNGMELIRSKLPKSIVGFLSLRLLVIQEDNLKHMFSGAEWSSSQSVKSLLYSERFWKSANEAVSVSEPLIKILRIVEGDMPAMGYIYEAMERVKMEIKAYYDCSAEKYMPIWEVIDRRWNTQLHSPLHAAAAFLNPSIIYSLNFKIDLKMRNGFQEAMMKMANEDKFKAEITKEHPVYLNAQGALGTEFAIMGRTINSPGDWWLAYGYEIPTLQRTAVRILSQPCSSHWCKWNWRTFQSVHAESRNGIEQEKFNDLAFVHCNLWLQAIVRRIHSGIKSKPISFNEIDVDSEWPVEFDCTASVPLLDDSWLDLFPLPIQSHSNRSGTP